MLWSAAPVSLSTNKNISAHTSPANIYKQGFAPVSV